MIRGGENDTVGGRQSLDLVQGLQEHREVLRNLESAALASVAETLVGVAESLARTACDLHEMTPTLWLDAEQAAAHVGAKSKDAFEKTAAAEGIPRHYLSSRQPRYNLRELDEWLMSR